MATKSEHQRRRWQDDADFVAWLISMEYAYRKGDGKIEANTSYGVTLYMYEAWVASAARCPNAP
jgi:hypothetical protein